MDQVLANLVREGLLTQEAARGVTESVAAGKPIDEALRGANGVSEEKVLRHLATYFDIPFVDLEKDAEKKAPSKEFLSRFPARILLDRRIMPLAENGDGVAVVTSRVFDTTGLDELRLATGLDVHPVLAPSIEIDRFIKKYLGVGADTLQEMGLTDEEDIKILEDDNDGNMDLTNAAHDASIVRFVNQIMAEALEMRATDVHIEPFENQLRVRYRVDGVLVEANIPPQVRKFQAAIVSRLKILSHLDIAEKRVPQDGRIRLKIAAREIDLRVSVIPMIHGEAVVLRILDRGDTVLGLEHLGMSARDNKIWQRVLDLPHGIILVTGPTGSGKTTTLYAALSKINGTDLKIITIEDPVEYQLAGINQIQVNTKSGLTFGAGLRAILRHDPDVVLVGEIRDRETAEIAVQASLTGHLVFSTLHTNDAPGAATRLVDMGIEPYLVSSSLEVVVAQRLVRLICKHCKEEMPQAEVEKLRAEFGDEVPPVIFKGRGCRNCQNTGYRGRQGLFEMMPVSDPIRALILSHSSSRDIRRIAVQEGMSSLREDGWRLIREGRTTPEEVLRMTKDEEVATGSAELQASRVERKAEIADAKNVAAALLASRGS
ncbi:MAG: GspE/PulE family protein [Planctomycetota bacterium]|nr:GspE/PulE family protein [Planctomycetota bacterium]